MEETKSYRIRTTVNGDAPSVVNVNLNQTYDMFEILSLKLGQDKVYKLYQSDYGVVVGRVLANKGFGIPNAKVSIFIPNESDNQSSLDWSLYPFMSVNSWAPGGTKYNLLPDEQQSECHQNVGTFPNKKLLLDNNDVIEVFDKYWKYTTVTNNAGDYMLYGIPTGTQQLHVDVDLSDIGVLSQKPRDMIYKGYDINTFDSPNKFKKSTTLESLPQIKSQDMGVYVYPFWGDTTDNGPIAITRCDINIDYTFEPTCVFMGSVITDSGSNAIGKNCRAAKRNGRMDELVSGEGTIEMIRKTFTGKVEEVKIQGGRVIDSDGVWCYQIPMNLDYVVTDEFGNLVPSDNPEIGIATRTRVRFRVTLDDTVNDATARKRAKYLVPNNPRVNSDNPSFSTTLEPDYEFGTQTKDESFRDLFWNNVYTVKNYIPRLQKNKRTSDKWHTGIKWINHYGDNNPMPYNSLRINLTFTYRFICILAKVFVNLIEFMNGIITAFFELFCELCDAFTAIGNATKWLFGLGYLFLGIAALFCAITATCIKVPKEFCDDGNVKQTFYPGCGMCVWRKTKKKHYESEKGCEKEDSCTDPTRAKDPLYNCLENQLAQDNDVTSFNFTNDWINGTLYMPLWFRKITPKRKYLFGLITIRAKDRWCSAENDTSSFRIYQPCSLKKTSKNSVTLYNGTTVAAYNKLSPNECKDNECHDREYKDIKVNKGVIQPKQTILDETVYYYRPVEFDKLLNTGTNKVKPNINGVDNNGEVKLLFATDIVLLGSLNDCDLHCTPQFFKNLDSTTYNMPEDLLLTDSIATPIITTKNGKSHSDDDKDYEVTYDFQSKTEMTGADWGNNNRSDQCGKPKDGDGGVFYSIGCSTIETKRKSCVNLERACEFGVTTDETAPVDVSIVENAKPTNISGTLIPDGFISYDELYNIDARGMFATLNGNNLKTKRNKNGFLEYDFRYLYPDNFDGSMYDIMRERQRKCDKSYAKNYALELYSEDYYHFRLGDEPYFYTSPTDPDVRLARYENSFYFYFGLKKGSTAIEKFNSQFFSDCTDVAGEELPINITPIGNSICSETSVEDSQLIEPDGTIEIDATGIDTPYTITMIDDDNNIYKVGYVENNNVVYDIIEEKIVITAGCQRNGKYHMYDGENACTNILNGSYDVIFEDSNTNIIESTIQMGNNEVSFSLDSMAFGVNNDGNLSECTLTTWDYVVGGASGSREGSKGLGGIVIIDELCGAVIGNSSIFGITLSKEDCTNVISFNVTIHKHVADNKISFTAEISNNTYARLAKEEVVNDELVTTVVNGNIDVGVANIKVYVAAWYGDENYTVDVTELCGSSPSNLVESDRRGTSTVFVSQPIPFKLYISGVDYDLISSWHAVCEEQNGGTHIDIKGWNKIATTGLEGLSEVKLGDWEDESNNTYNVYNKIRKTDDGTSPYNWGGNTDAYVYKLPSDVEILSNGKIEIKTNNKETFTSIITVIPNGYTYLIFISADSFNVIVDENDNVIFDGYNSFYEYVTHNPGSRRNTAYGSNSYYLVREGDTDSDTTTIIFNTDGAFICFNDLDWLRNKLTTINGDTPFITEEQFDNIEVSEINQSIISDIRTQAKNIFRTCTDDDKKVEKDRYRDEQRESGDIYGTKPKVYYSEPPENPSEEQLTTLVLQYFGDDVDAFDTIENFFSEYGIVSYRTELTDTYNFCGNIIYSNTEIDHRYDVVDDMNDIFNNRLELVLTVKEAFWKMCENDDKMLILTSETSSPPVTYKIDYNPEFEDEDNGVRGVEKRVYDYEANQISDIEIPTIVRYSCPLNDYNKGSYDVSASNSRNQIIPSGNKFGVHFIDKVLTCEYTLWAGVEDCIEDTVDGVTTLYPALGYMNGAKILNGILNSEGKLNSAVIGNYDADYNSIDIDSGNTENSLPTYRTINSIYGENHELWPKREWEANQRPWYKTSTWPSGWPIEYRDASITVSDDYCTYSEELYPRMGVVIESSTLNPSDQFDYKNYVKANVTNCNNTGGKLAYYIYPHYENIITKLENNQIPDLYTKTINDIRNAAPSGVTAYDYDQENNRYRSSGRKDSNCGLFSWSTTPNGGRFRVVAVYNNRTFASTVVDMRYHFYIELYFKKKDGGIKYLEERGDWDEVYESVDYWTDYYSSTYTDAFDRVLKSTMYVVIKGYNQNFYPLNENETSFYVKFNTSLNNGYLYKGNISDIQEIAPRGDHFSEYGYLGKFLNQKLYLNLDVIIPEPNHGKEKGDDLWNLIGGIITNNKSGTITLKLDDSDNNTIYNPVFS